MTRSLGLAVGVPTAWTPTRPPAAAGAPVEQALPVDVLVSRDGPPRLTLVTCGGPFLPDVGGYRDNVVVVAEPVP